MNKFELAKFIYQALDEHDKEGRDFKITSEDNDGDFKIVFITKNNNGQFIKYEIDISGGVEVKHDKEK